MVAKTLEGSEEAFRQLVLKYQKPVYRLLLRLLRDPSRAEDIAQETFLKAYRALRTYQPDRKFLSWIFKIAHNTAIDSMRRKQLDLVALETPDRELPGPISRLEDPTVPSPDGVVRGRDLARDLTQAVSELEPLYRELVLLRFQEGLSYQEIVEVTGLAMGTVKTRLHRGRKQLADRLTGAGWGQVSQP